MAIPLTRLIPRPELVTLGGERRPVLPLRLADLATLQEWLAAAAGNPLDDLPARSDDPEPATRRRRVLAAWTAAKVWPPAYGSAEAGELAATPAGLVAFVLVCLRTCDDLADLADAASLTARMTVTEWRDLRRAAYGLDVWEQLVSEIDPDYDPAFGSSPIDWGEAFEEVSRERGWTYAQIAELRLPQWRSVLSGGQGRSYRATVKPGETLKDAYRRTRRLFNPDLDPEPPIN